MDTFKASVYAGPDACICWL